VTELSAWKIAGLIVMTMPAGLSMPLGGLYAAIVQ